MDVDKWKNDLLTSHKTGEEKEDIQSRLNSWYASLVTDSLSM